MEFTIQLIGNLVQVQINGQAIKQELSPGSVCTELKLSYEELREMGEGTHNI